jgi:hypothetical protein
MIVLTSRTPSLLPGREMNPLSTSIPADLLTRYSGQAGADLLIESQNKRAFPNPIEEGLPIA